MSKGYVEVEYPKDCWHCRFCQRKFGKIFCQLDRQERWTGSSIIVDAFTGETTKDIQPKPEWCEIKEVKDE